MYSFLRRFWLFLTCRPSRFVCLPTKLNVIHSVPDLSIIEVESVKWTLRHLYHPLLIWIMHRLVLSVHVHLSCLWKIYRVCSDIFHTSKRGDARSLHWVIISNLRRRGLEHRILLLHINSWRCHNLVVIPEPFHVVINWHLRIFEFHNWSMILLLPKHAHLSSHSSTSSLLLLSYSVLSLNLFDQVCNLLYHRSPARLLSLLL